MAKPVELEGCRDEAGSRWVRWEDRKGVARWKRWRMEWSRAAAKPIKRWLLLLMGGMPVSGVPLPKLNTQTGGAAVGVEGCWVVVVRNKFRRFSALKPMSQVGHKGGALAFIGLRTNIACSVSGVVPILGSSPVSCEVVVSLKVSALGRCRKLLTHGGKNNTLEEESKERYY